MGSRWKMVHGKTHSFNAIEAEERGEMPITRAIEAIYKSFDCKQRKISRKKVREFLEKNCYCGWHHIAAPNGVQEVAYYSTDLDEDKKNKLLGINAVVVSGKEESAG